MILIYIVLAVAAAAGALMEFYVRFLPAERENRAKKLEEKNIVREQVNQALSNAESYKNIGFRMFGLSYTGDIIPPVLKK